MKGHFLSGTRKLNKHYQSGGGWKLLTTRLEKQNTGHTLYMNGLKSGYLMYDGIWISSSSERKRFRLNEGDEYKVTSLLPLWRQAIHGSPKDLTVRGTDCVICNLYYNDNEEVVRIPSIENWNVIAPSVDNYTVNLEMYYPDYATGEKVCDVQFKKIDDYSYSIKIANVGEKYKGAYASDNTIPLQWNQFSFGCYVWYYSPSLNDTDNIIKLYKKVR